MFLKYLEISRHTDQILEEKLWSWRSYFWLSCRLFTCNFFLKWIYTQAVFRILIALKKTHFKKHFWMAASVKSSTFFFLVWAPWPPQRRKCRGVKSSTFNLSTFRCVVIISVSNDISEFTEHLSGSNKVHYPISNRNDFTVAITSVVGRQLYWCKMSSLHYIWCFSSKIAFVNWDKSAGICGLVQTNELNF